MAPTRHLPAKAFALLPFSICLLLALALCSCAKEAADAPPPAISEPAPALDVTPEDSSAPAEDAVSPPAPDAEPAAGPPEEAAAAPPEEAAGAGSEENASESPAAAAALATFGAGCFWCVEAVMERLEGVIDARSGYMGGHVDNPTYEQVIEKTTGHIEVVQVEYDPAKISFDDLLDVFWQAHDPTSWDQQGADKGPQYRSAIFAHSPEQKAQAQKSKATLDKLGTLPGPIVTEIREAETFWEAEDYHQDFFANNPNHGYCRVVISPKLKQLGLD